MPRRYAETRNRVFQKQQVRSDVSGIKIFPDPLGTPPRSQFMNAIRIHNYGGPEVLQYENTPRPEPGKGEVLVRVHAAGVNPLDWKVRSGLLNGFIEHRLPLIPGWDVSGVVEEIGGDVVPISKIRSAASSHRARTASRIA